MYTQTQERLSTAMPLVTGDALRPSRTTRSYLPVESVQRALLILRHLNELEVAQVSQLSYETGVPKATVVRMLETLMAEGFVARDECLGGYRVTSGVKSLSVGFSGRLRLIELARGHLLELTRKLRWPVSIASINGDRVTLGFSTSPVCHWSYPFPVIGESMDIMTSSLGRVSLAYSEPEQREALIRTKAATVGMEEQDYADIHAGPVIETVSTAGYAFSIPVKGEHRFQFVAVPIFGQGRFLTALGMGYYMSAVPAGDVHRNFIVPLQEAAETIQTAWETD